MTPVRLAAALVAFSAHTASAQSAATPTQPVVSTEWLATNATLANLVVLHVGSRQSYETSHITGAVLTELSAIALSRVGPDSLNLELPPADDLRRRLEALGIGDSSLVVVYPAAAQQISQATRVMFTLDHAGLGARSFLLAGGLPKWSAEGRATTTVATTIAPGRLTPREHRDNVTLIDWLSARTKTQGVTVIDARAANFWSGTSQNGSQRPGHVPGARNIPYTSIFTASLEPRSVEELRKLFDDAGVRSGDTVVVYCHIGQQATAVIFGARLLGINARLFDGSFEQWSRHQNLPVERPGGGGSVPLRR